MPGEVTRRALRSLLDVLLPMASDFDALCIDHFPRVNQRFANGMDRTSRTNLLLAQAQPDDILAALSQICDEDELHERLAQLQAARGYARECESEALSARLEVLLLERDRLASEASSAEQPLDLSVRNAEIAAIKKELRRGPRLNEGEILDERFILQQRIGHGGYGDVWLAFDRGRQCLVALKVLHGRREDPNSIERFYRGARVLMQLSHPHLVHVLEPPGEHEGFHYFVMEYVHGGDLERAMREDRVDRPQALQALLQAASALAYAHQRGLIHRDVKPTNILLDGAGCARLTDFDLVSADDSTGGTASGVAMGTLLYSAPEVHEDARRADERSDVYSLGMTLLCVLYGRPLPRVAIFHGLDFARQQGCPSAFLPLIEAATADQPSLRPAGVREFSAWLEAAIAADRRTQPLSALPPAADSADSTQELAPSQSSNPRWSWTGSSSGLWGQHNRWLGWALSALTLAVGVGFVLMGLRGPRSVQVPALVPSPPTSVASLADEALSQRSADRGTAPVPLLVPSDPVRASEKEDETKASSKSPSSKPAAHARPAAKLSCFGEPPPRKRSAGASRQNPELLDMVLAQAQTEYSQGHFSQAIRMARTALTDSPLRAWRIIGAAACQVGDRKLVQAAYDCLKTAERGYLILVCEKRGIRIASTSSATEIPAKKDASISAN